MILTLQERVESLKKSRAGMRTTSTATPAVDVIGL
jgi:hypothetical protein